MMRIDRTHLAALALFAAGSGPLSGQEAADPASFPEVVARVNGIEISKRELLTQAEITRRQMMRSGAQDPWRDLGFHREVLEGLVGETLVFERARREGAVVSAEAVDQAVESMAQRFPERAAFEKALQDQGSNLELLKRQLEQTMTLERILEVDLGGKIEIPETEKRSFYDRNIERMRLPERRKVRHILVQAAPAAGDEERRRAREKAEGILARLKRGEDFATLARQLSDDPRSREQGGEMPWVVRTGRHSYEEPIFALEGAGSVSEVAETPMGYHLFQLIDEEPARVRGFEEVEEEIEGYLRAHAVRAEVMRQVEAMRVDAEIEILI